MAPQRLKTGILNLGEVANDYVRRIRGIFDVGGYIPPPSSAPPPLSPEERQARSWGVRTYDPSMTYCPPRPFTITGVAPKQAAGKAIYVNKEANQLSPGGVAIRPDDLGIPDRDWRKHQDELKAAHFAVLWDEAPRVPGAPAMPAGIPSLGPYYAAGNIGQKSDRLKTPNHIDLFGYTDRDQAFASTRKGVPTVAYFPKTSRSLKCP